MTTIAIFIAAAIGPAAVLMYYVYKKDTVEKEPLDLLGKLILGGCLAAVLSGILEQFAISVLDSLVDPSHPFYIILLAFLVVAVIEEGTKYFFLRRRTWNNLHFNYCFDGIVYAVFVSLGFAALENIGYVAGFGLSVAPARAILAIPAHMGFSVFMGYFYGRAKRLQLYGENGKSRRERVFGYLMAVFLHGFYDACAMTGTELASMIFFGFVVIMDIAVIYTIRRGSKEDEPL